LYKSTFYLLTYLPTLLTYLFCWLLGTFFFVGAVNRADRLPWHLWTRNQQFFVGCIWGVRINGGDIEDLPRFALQQRVIGVEPGCKTKPLACAHPQCTRGVCEDRSKSFICVCTNTSYTGQLCDEGLFLNHFSSVQYTVTPSPFNALRQISYCKHRKTSTPSQTMDSPVYYVYKCGLISLSLFDVSQVDCIICMCTH